MSLETAWADQVETGPASVTPPLNRVLEPATFQPDRQVGRVVWGVAIPFGAALFGSGAAGLVNQVVWQRSLKVFLGGSETICSMIVVLVFMAGLGVGSVVMGRRSARLRDPLRAFVAVECLLAVVNLAVCALLASDVTATVFGVQKLAITLGIPLLLVYAVCATLILFVPCLLMGMTMPLAAESCQRNLGLREPRLLGLLFFVNTLGSVLGAVVSSGYLIAHCGLTCSLLLAATMNFAAGTLLWMLLRLRYKAFRRCRTDDSAAAMQPRKLSRNHADAVTLAEAATKRRGWSLGPYELLALGLGFCSLGYEMYLFRLIPLRHEPLPFTFAAVLTGFLSFWSFGAALSSWRRSVSLATGLRICAIAAVATIPIFVLDEQTPITGTVSLLCFVLRKAGYFLPCVCFGYLFGLVMRQAAKSWGHDVGRLSAFNTVGSCLGIVTVTFIGFEIPFFVMILALGLLLFAMQEYVANFEGLLASRDEIHEEPPRPPRSCLRARPLIPALAAAGCVGASFVVDLSGVIPGQRMYSGRDGVVIVQDNGDLIWDGLWHSKLSRNADHIGTNNWQLAVCPVICHATGDIEDACVIGMGAGITATTLAKLSTVKQVDGYEISHVLKDVYRDFPEGTLHLSDNPKINLIWQDARTGLALSPKQYDIIQTQPLYLKQAGSGLLNSVEFFKLVQRRLKPHGVFCLYSNGSAEQAMVIRQTADRVFPYRVSFLGGYLLVLSNDPIELTEQRLSRRLANASGDSLWEEIRRYPRTKSSADILELLDQPSLSGRLNGLLVTDDHPIVEYPAYLSSRIAELADSVVLPVEKSPLFVDSR